MVVGGTEGVDRAYVESPGQKSGTNCVVQPLGQSLELGQYESGDAGGYIKWWERWCRRTNYGTTQKRLARRTRTPARRIAPRPVPSQTGTQGVDTKARNEREKAIRSARHEGSSSAGITAPRIGAYL